jgi:hypothetical protein
VVLLSVALHGTRRVDEFEPTSIWTDGRTRAYRRRMDARATCALCGDAIEPGQAWMANEMDGGRAHAGCVYRDEHEPERRERWLPAEIAEITTPTGVTRDLTRP